MSKILLDSSIIVDFLRLKNRDFTFLQQLVDQKYQSYISIITHTELYAGKSIWKSDLAQKELERILLGIEILKLDEKISMEAGKLRSTYNIEITDAIIAATALYHKLELVTLNTKDFQEISGLKLKTFKD